MRRQSHRREARIKPVTADHRGLNRYRTCLIGGIFAYLVLAFVSAHWLPNESYVEWIFIFFAAHTATYLLREVRGHDDVEPSSGR